MFVDIINVNIAAGNGGNGKLSFRHEKYVEKGGPDGGDGGNGGDVIFMASRNKNTLAEFRYIKTIVAPSGGPGDKRKKHGKSGKDLVVKVPIGTMVSNAENGAVIADLIEDEQQAVVAKGGKGGFGNAHFKSSTRQAPRLAELGEKGEQLDVVLEMKMVADIGLVGLPNAGKSTLLSVISSAKPEIGYYAFTTKSPNLGVVDIENQSFLVADIPGLIEGASQGKGLGAEFLRHISRCKVLLHLIDSTSSDIAKDYHMIEAELSQYGQGLLEKPQLIVLTKAELADDDIIKMQQDFLKPVLPKSSKIFAVSSSAHIGIKQLLHQTAKIIVKLDKQVALQKEQELPVITLKESPEAWQASQLKQNTYLVTGAKIEGFAKRTDYSQSQAIFRLKDIMRRMGILNELNRLGIEPGNKIIIGNPKVGELEY